MGAAGLCAGRHLGVAARRGGPGAVGLADLGSRLTRARCDRAAAREADTVASTDRLAAALDALAQGVVIADRTGRVVFRNVHASTFVGARHGDALVEQQSPSSASGRSRRVRSSHPRSSVRRGARSSSRSAARGGWCDHRRLGVGRRHDRADTSRSGAHRLRRQHQPRAEDARRRARRCSPRRCSPRTTPRSRQRWPSGCVHRGATASAAPSTTCSSSVASRSSEAPRREPCPCTCVIAEAVDRVRPARRPAAASQVEVDRAAPERAHGRRRSPPARLGDRQPARERGEVLRRRASSVAGATLDRRPVGRASMVADHGIGIPAPRPRAGSSSASTGSTRPAAATPAAPASASRSCATWPPTTAARCRCQSAGGRGLDVHAPAAGRPPVRSRVDRRTREAGTDDAMTQRADHARGRGRGLASSRR